MLKKTMSTICAVILFLNALLHVLLLMGAPLGEFVLGGRYVVIPLSMRMINVFFAFLWIFIGLLYFNLAGIIKLPISNKVMRIILWINTLFFFYAIFGNLFLSESIKETYVMTPLSIITSVCSITALLIQKMVQKSTT